ncbi:sulfotransferase ssu-1-like [Dermacentor variabilis]|uniref:sulfotransferase ssu-1-like n=1 Tax=Dermacentor variabilis TaxID=34621 RepID=UPI003F5C6CC7
MSSEAKYIYVVRNPWDVCVSFYPMATSLSAYRFQHGTFDQFFDAFLSEDVAGYGNYFDHVVSGYELKDIPNVFFVTYENLTKDIRGTVLKLARFLGDSYAVDLAKDNRMLSELPERCSADHMKETMVLDLTTNTNPGIDKMLRRLHENCKDGHNGDSKKYCFVREAKVGWWKRYFSREQLRRLEETIKKVEEILPVMELWSGIREEATATSTDK